MEKQTNSAAAAATLISLAGAAKCKLAVQFSVANKGSLPALARTKTLSIPIISFRSQPPAPQSPSLHRHDHSIIKVQTTSVQLSVKTAAVNTNQAWFPLHLPASPVHTSVLPPVGDASQPSEVHGGTRSLPSHSFCWMLTVSGCATRCVAQELKGFHRLFVSRRTQNRGPSLRSHIHHWSEHISCANPL